MKDIDKTIVDLVNERNSIKTLFTAGPASLLPQNLTGMRPCFGRGDSDYDNVENTVLTTLKKMSGHANIARLQGSASLALEIAALNFLYGKVLIVDTGYYSERLKWLTESASRTMKLVKQIDTVYWKELDSVSGNYDWVWACPTETSMGIKIPIDLLAKLAKNLKSRLMLDATASIGLESDHHLADAIAYSSCKGLFGLTGACFIAFNEMPEQQVNSFYLDLTSHLEKRMTGPYHAIASLVDVLPEHSAIRESVIINKERFISKMKNKLTLPESNQPLLCTHVNCDIFSDDPNVVLYKPRNNLAGSIVCHLGEVHKSIDNQGQIIEKLRIK
ncbi:hypothetical protein N8303_04520 [Gammaproteobacteria bacterium]|nr:hypothetical protein [Gammaproteobacteria bacterium]